MSPSATVYLSPPAAGDGLGEAPGDGDAAGRIWVPPVPGEGLAAGDGLADGPAAVLAAGVGVAEPPPIQPQAVSRIVPITSAWTHQRGRGGHNR